MSTAFFCGWPCRHPLTHASRASSRRVVTVRKCMELALAAGAATGAGPRKDHQVAAYQSPIARRQARRGEHPLSLPVPAALHAFHPTQSPLHWPSNVCCWSAQTILGQQAPVFNRGRENVQDESVRRASAGGKLLAPFATVPRRGSHRPAPHVADYRAADAYVCVCARPGVAAAAIGSRKGGLGLGHRRQW
jgi:hypothetical protein